MGERFNLGRALTSVPEDRCPERGISARIEADFRDYGLTGRGGIFVPTLLASDGPIDTQTGSPLVLSTAGPYQGPLRPRPVVQRLGATVLPGLGPLRIPRIDGPIEVEWISEAPEEPADDAELTFGETVPPLRTAYANLGISRQLLKQSVGDIQAERLVRRELEAAVAAAVDIGSLSGTGPDQPTGLIHTSGVPSISLGTDGGALSWAHVLEAERRVAEAGAGDGNLAWVATPRLRERLKQTERASGSGFIWSGDRVNGHLAFGTPHLPSDLTKGSGTALSAAAFGDFSRLVIALHAVEILTDRTTYVRRGIVELSVFAHLSVGIAAPAAFIRIVDATVS